MERACVMAFEAIDGGSAAGAPRSLRSREFVQV
jgi:hypothetical protein